MSAQRRTITFKGDLHLSEEQVQYLINEASKCTDANYFYFFVADLGELSQANAQQQQAKAEADAKQAEELKRLLEHKDELLSQQQQQIDDLNLKLAGYVQATSHQQNTTE